MFGSGSFKSSDQFYNKKKKEQVLFFIVNIDFPKMDWLYTSVSLATILSLSQTDP